MPVSIKPHLGLGRRRPRRPCPPAHPPARPPAALCAAPSAPPTVADAKAAFLSKFSRPLPTIYSTVVLELLVQQHLFRWTKRYQYSEVGA